MQFEVVIQTAVELRYVKIKCELIFQLGTKLCKIFEVSKFKEILCTANIMFTQHNILIANKSRSYCVHYMFTERFLNAQLTYFEQQYQL